LPPFNLMNNLHPVDSNIIATIRVSLRMDIAREWKHRRDPFVRGELKNTILALRTIRKSFALYREKYPLAK
jgi:hypothetical protein